MALKCLASVDFPQPLCPKIATKLLLDGMSDAEAAEYFVREYGTTADKAQLAVRVAMAEMPVRESMYKDGVSIYIGIPFCPTRCLYCSFVTWDSKGGDIGCPL